MHYKSISLQGAGIEFVGVDETNRQWVTDFHAKAISPSKLEETDGELVGAQAVLCKCSNARQVQTLHLITWNRSVCKLP